MENTGSLGSVPVVRVVTLDVGTLERATTTVVSRDLGSACSKCH